MIDAIGELMPTSTSFDLAVGYFYISGFELIKFAFSELMAKPDANVRVLMGNQTNVLTREALSQGQTPEEAALQDISDTDEDQASILHQFSKWMRSGRVQVKVYTGDANYFHAKSYLFQEDEHGLKGSAIVGSSNFSKAGLSGNTELNTFSQDNYRALKNWFDTIWDSDEVKDFSPELIKAVNEKLPHKDAEDYIPALATYLEFAKQYAKPPLNIGADGFWTALYPHQKIGVAECVNRIRQYGTALLCDGVGLGKTRTAAGVIKEFNTPKTLLLASSKLHEQWRRELEAVGVYKSSVYYLSKESLARLSASELRELAEYELVIIDEAHQGFKNSGRKMYRNMQYMLQYAKKPIYGLLLTATPWNNSRSDVFHLGRLFLRKENIPGNKPYANYLQFASRKAGRAFESDEKAFAAFWEDLFLQRTRKTYGGEEVSFAKRNFPTVEIIYEPKKQQALEDNFERISKLRLPYMDPLRYMEDTGDEFASDRLKLLFLKRADSSWVSFVSTLESIYSKLIKLQDELELVGKEDSELKRRFRQWITSSYGIDQNFADFSSAYLDETEDLTDFEITSRENRARYVRKMTERIEAINKRQAKKTVIQLLRDTEEDIKTLDLIREDLADAFNRKDEKFEAVRDAVQQAAASGEKVIIISQFRDTTINYFERLVNDQVLQEFRIAHVSGKPYDCFIGRDFEPMVKEEILNRFAPVAKNLPHFSNSAEEIDIVIGTDTLSVGQNLQDCRVIMNLDLPYNPMILEQRIGRIDRPRQDGQVQNIDIYTFPSIPVIEAELKMTDRLRTKLEGIFNDTRFDDLVLPEYEGFLRSVLKERGQAVEKMLDDTVERSIAPVHSPSHSSEYVKAQERLWSYLQKARPLVTENPVLPNMSVGSQFNDNETTAIVSTILRDVNEHEIEKLDLPITIESLDSDFVKVEAMWHRAIVNSADSTLDISKNIAKAEYRKVQKKLREWTAYQVNQYNEHIEEKKRTTGSLIETKAKNVAADIVAATKGSNRMFIIEQIKAAGYSPKILKTLSSSIEYIDSRDPEFLDVLDLHEDLNRLWADFAYYAEKFIGPESAGENTNEVFKQFSGRKASLENSETLIQIGHLYLQKTNKEKNNSAKYIV
ncbi:helicase-related protein [Planococcus sp. CP5-4_UN]|nr:helicase-related protein [Planococcus sp. CP5-4_UN]